MASKKNVRKRAKAKAAAKVATKAQSGSEYPMGKFGKGNVSKIADGDGKGKGRRA